MVLTIRGMSAPPTLWAVFQADHQTPRSVREYQLVSSLEQGGPAPALEEGVGDPEGGKHPECRREAEQDIDHAGGHQPDPHEVARIGAVADDAGEELGAAVGDVEQGPEHADV